MNAVLISPPLQGQRSEPVRDVSYLTGDHSDVATVAGAHQTGPQTSQAGPVSFEDCVAAYEQTLSVHKAGALLGISGQALHYRLKKGSYRLKGQKFDADEDQAIRDAYAMETLDLDGLSKSLGRPKTNVSRRARELGCDTKYGRPLSAKAKAKIGSAMKASIATNGHPKGALGITHSETTRKVIAEQSRASNAKLKAENRGPYSEENRQLSSDRMSKLMAGRTATESYSRAKRGVRADIGPMHFRSKWEANYARYLNWLVSQGEIDRWEYEVETFWFEKIKRGVRSYTPDFKIYEKGTEYFVEVKGWLDPKSKTKLKRMAKYYPKTKVILFGEKSYRSLSQKLGRVIPGWE